MPARGIALVMVLWVLTLLSVIAGSLAFSMRTEVRLTAGMVERAQARALASGAIHYAVARLMMPVEHQPWHADGTPRALRYREGEVTVRLTDVGGRVDLNRGGRELLGLLLRAAGEPEDRVDPILDAIEDWMDADDLVRLQGAERAEYLAAGRDYGPKNARFESVDELGQVLGVSRETHRALAPHLTVFAASPGVNPEYASATLLKAILPDVDPALIDAYVAQRREAREQNVPPPPPPVSSPHFASRAGVVYHVEVEASLDGGARAFVAADILVGSGGGVPFTVLQWRENP